MKIVAFGCCASTPYGRADNPHTLKHRLSTSIDLGNDSSTENASLGGRPAHHSSTPHLTYAGVKFKQSMSFVHRLYDSPSSRRLPSQALKTCPLGLENTNPCTLRQSVEIRLSEQVIWPIPRSPCLTNVRPVYEMVYHISNNGG